MAFARCVLLIELDLVLGRLWGLLFLGCVHKWRLLGRRHGCVIVTDDIFVLEDGLLLQLVLRWTYSLCLRFLLFLENLRQVRLALKSFIRRAFVTLLHLRHSSVDY